MRAHLPDAERASKTKKLRGEFVKWYEFASPYFEDR